MKHLDVEQAIRQRNRLAAEVSRLRAEVLYLRERLAVSNLDDASLDAQMERLTAIRMCELLREPADVTRRRRQELERL